MSAPVSRFLAAQPLSRAALGEQAMNFFESATPTQYGEAWRALAAEAGVPCPDALVELGDAMAEQFIYFRFRGHQYAMLTRTGAREERRFLSELATSYREVVPFTAMLPLLGEDGDHLLLDANGALWATQRDDAPPPAPAVSSLEALLGEAVAPTINF